MAQIFDSCPRPTLPYQQGPRRLDFSLMSLLDKSGRRTVPTSLFPDCPMELTAPQIETRVTHPTVLHFGLPRGFGRIHRVLLFLTTKARRLGRLSLPMRSSPYRSEVDSYFRVEAF